VLDSGVEPQGAFVGGKEVGLQRCACDGWAAAVAAGRFGLQRVDFASRSAASTDVV
jgi:hypothetical protein